MSVTRRGAKLLLAATFTAQACALVRYMLLARLLGPEQLGLAAALILINSFVEIVTDSGADRFLVQDAEGDSPRVQGLVQLLLAGRGVFIALVFLIGSVPLSYAYHAPALAGGLVLLSLSPLLSGLAHTDMARKQREHDFRNEGAATLAAEIISTAVTAGMVLLTRDFTAAAWGLIARAAVTAVVTHIIAERPFRFAFAREHARRLSMFAAPLMLNGLVLFLGQQGDRVFVGGYLGVEQLGRYSVVGLLAFYPMSVLMRYVSVLNMPWIAGARDDKGKREAAITLLAGQALLLSVVLLTGFVVAAPLAIHLLFGPQYAQPLFIIGLVGFLQVSRFFRLWPITTALTLGSSSVVMITNVVRLVIIGLLCGVVLPHTLAGIITGFIVAELVALAMGLVMANRLRDQHWSVGMDRFALFLAYVLALVGWTRTLGHPSALVIGAMTTLTLVLLLLIMLKERATLASGWGLFKNAVRHTPLPFQSRT